MAATKKSENPLGYTCYDCHQRLLHEEERWQEYLQEYHEEMRRKKVDTRIRKWYVDEVDFGDPG